MAFNPDEFIKSYKPAEAAPFDPDEFLKTNTRKLTPFTGSAAASIEKLKGDFSVLAGKAGLKDIAQAEADKRRNDAIAAGLYTPTTEGWMEAPGTKFAELAGGSLPYMAAPAAAAVVAPAALGGMGAAGLAALASTAQFTGSNLSRQMDEGKSLEQASLRNAAAAAVPQAALDIIGFRMIPGLRNLFGHVGKELSEDAALELAKRSVAQKAADYTLATGKVMSAEGLTETGQQVLERLQAGLSITDPQARQEYFDSFVGGAVLGGALSIPGQAYESMGRAKKEEPPETGVPPVTPAQPQPGGPRSGPQANAGYNQAGTPPPGGPTGEPPLYRVPTPPELPAPDQPGLPPPPRALTATPEPKVPSTEGLAPIPFQTVKYDTGAPGNKRYEEGQAPIIDYSGRKIVMHNVNGVQVPFYLSTGTGGKTDVPAGKWYPFFGIGSDGWINKTGGQEMANYYGSDALRQAGEQLDASIGDIRNDNKIPKVSSTGAHIDFINQGFTPTENQTKNTIATVRQNIDNTLARINQQNGSVTPVTPSQNVQQNQATNNLPEGFEHFEEVQPNGTIKAGIRRIETPSAPVEQPAQEITPELTAEEKPATPQEEKYTDIGGKNKMRVREHFDEGIPQFTAYAQNEDGEFIHGDTFGSYELAVAWAERNKDKPEIDWSWGDIQNKVAKAKANRERQAAKQLNKIDASSIPLSTYYMGVQLGLTRQKEEDLERMTDKKAKPALIILEANNLIVKKPDGSYDLAPKGRQLLDELQSSYSLKNSPTQEEQENFFAKYISQLANKKEKPVEVAPAEKELTEEEKTAAANRQRQKVAQARALGKANRTDALSAYLARLGGISSKDKLDVARDKSVKGYNHIFKSGAPSLMARVEDGQLDDYLPYELRRQTHESNSEQPYDATEAYDYISDIIASGEPKRPHDKEEAAAQQELAKEQEAKQAREEEAARAEEEAIKKANEELDMVSKEEREAEAESRIYEEPKEKIELKGETKEEIAAKEKAARAEANRKRQKEQQEKAAEAAGEFTLTGSNREADVAAAKGAQDLFAAKPNEITKGNRVFLPKATLKGKVAQTGIVNRVLDNGKIEVRLQEGGYETLDKSELSLTKEGLGLEQIKSTEPKNELILENGKVDNKKLARILYEKDVKAIEDMDPEVRDNTVHYDMPGGSPAYNIYEAKKMLPKPSDKLKKVTYENSMSLWQEYDYIANIDGELYGITKQEDPDEPDDESMFVYYYNKLFEPFGNHVSAWTDNKDDLFEYIRKQDNPAPVKQIEEIKSFKDATQDLENHRTKDAHTETEVAIENFAKEAVADFMVGDVVRYGNIEGRVVGVEGDYVKFRPDTATNPKAYQKVQKKQLKFQSRPAVGINFSASSKGEDNKFGEEQGKLVMDQERMLQLFGQNMYGAGLANVAIKELLQNSFDAVKGAVRTKVIKEGDIKITINKDTRTIKIQDNGKGMTPQIIRDAFFTIAGTDKSDLPPQERSGGFGIAKMGFLTGVSEIRLETIRDGVKSVVSATSNEIVKSNFKIMKSPAPKSMHGTTIEVTIPEKYIDTKNGEERSISFPYDIDYIDPLNQPLIGPSKVTLDFINYGGNLEQKVLPVGVNFDNKETPLLTKANFSWGTAEIYFGVKRAEYPKHYVLSSGVYQFRQTMQLSQSEAIPYNIIINIKSDVPAGDIDYPFENSRERFKERIKNDIDSLQAFLAKVARGEEAREMQENFGGIVSMPRVEAGADIVDVSKKLIKAFDKRGTEDKKTHIPTLPKVIEIKDNVVSDGKGNVIVDMQREAEKKKESTFVAEMDAPTRDQFMLTMKQDPKLPIFHNNTNVDYVAIGTPYGDPQAFFAELGTLMVEMKEELAKSGMWSYDQLSPENLFFAGVSVDKGYGGVHIKVPYKAVLLNPFYDWGSKSLFGVRATFLNTMIHELAHQGDMDHGVGHNSQMIKVENYLADAGMLDYFRDALMDVLARHESTFTAMKEAYGSSTTKNTAKSLATDKQGAASARGIRDGSKSASGFILAGERRAGRISLREAVEQDTEGQERRGPDGLDESNEIPFNSIGRSKVAVDDDTNYKVMMSLAEKTRKEIIADYAGLKRRIQTMSRKIADVGSTLQSQKELNEAYKIADAYKEIIKSTEPKNDSADRFVAKAKLEYAAGNISKDVMDVIDFVNKKYPNLLEGLKLSVRMNKGSDALGRYEPFKRLVSLFKGTDGVTDAETIRHELCHTLEQLMTPAARIALIEAWSKAFVAAEAKYKDKRSKEYFKKVKEFLQNPSSKTLEDATDACPDIKNLYQYLNPSEYWAVNAEKLMAAKMGTPWVRFVNSIKKLYEGIKSVFGYDNNYVVHQVFDQVFNGEGSHDKNGDLLTNYLFKNGTKLKYASNIKKDNDLMNDYGVPETPSHESESVKEMLTGKFSKMKAKYAQFKNQPKDEANNLFKAAGDTALSARIKAVYFGAGLESEEFKRYNGKIRNAFGEILPSVILKNAMKASYIYAEVIKLGHMQYDAIHENFMAKANKYSMGNVLRLQHELRQKLGTALADKVINSYHAAKRARSMQNSYLDAMKNVQQLTDDAKAATDPALKEKLKAELEDAKKYLQSIRRAFIQVPNYLCAIDPVNPTVVVNGKRVKNIMFDRDDMPILNDEAVDRLIAQEKDHPQLAEILKNFTSVNHNMLDMMAFSGRISKGMVEKLKAIKDYSPFTRVVDDPITELFGERNVGVNTAGIKHFKLTRTERELDNVVDSMMHNIGTMIRSSTKTYAQVKIAREFATRRPDETDPKTGKVTRGKIRVYPTEGKTDNAVYFPIYANGKKVVVEIPNRNVGEAMIGLAMGPMEYEFQKVLAGFANFTRRSITFTGYFQAKQVFYDAPSAALVSGVKDPFRLWAGCFSSFANSVSNIVTDQPDSATIQILKSAGVGGFQGYFRETSAEFKTRMGIFSGSNYSKAMELIDKIGDASDFSQREATYNRVLKESGDPALALLQANDIIDFSRHGTSQFAQGMRQTIPFMQAFATQMDAITQAAQGKNLKGKAREDAQKQFAKTALMLAGVTLAYVAMCAADDDYFELDDDTRARNFYIPFSKKTFGYPILLPMHSTSSLFWKVMPEMLIHKMITDGTKNEMDGTRLWKAFTNAFADSMLGPTPVPSLIKPPIEITLNRNFYTGNTLTPRGMENLIAEEKYTAKTSELGKFLSAATGRILNPIEADHLGNGWAGSVYSLTAWASNAIFGENRVATAPSENPFLAGFVGQEVSRKNESLFYGLKDKTEPAYGTYMAKLAKGNEAETISFYNKNKDLIQAHEYVSAVEQDLKAINKMIKDIGKSEAQDENGKVYTPEKKLELITQYKEMKSQLLNNVIAFRKQAGL